MVTCLRLCECVHMGTHTCWGVGREERAVVSLDQSVKVYTGGAPSR